MGGKVMRSIKQGRGPSFFSAVISFFMVGFGVLWTVIALRMAGPLFALFGVFWTAIALTIAILNLRNAISRKRYSMYDIVDHTEEPDPLNERFGNQPAKHVANGNETFYCPWCGAKAEPGHRYCSQCGGELPQDHN